MKILETKRLYLRKMEQSDFGSLCKILQDKEVMYAYVHTYDDAGTQMWLNKQLERYEKNGYGLWAVVLKDTEKMIGQCGLTNQNWNNRKVLEIGYLFQKEFWHKGYATEAAIACKEYAFNRLNVDEVFSIINDTNIASQNVAKRNGMTEIDRASLHKDGIAYDALLFSVKRTK